MSKPLNLDGQKFGDWIVLSTEIKLCGKKTNSICTCRCSCGKIKEVRATFLKKVDQVDASLVQVEKKIKNTVKVIQMNTKYL